MLDLFMSSSTNISSLCFYLLILLGLLIAGVVRVGGLTSLCAIVWSISKAEYIQTGIMAALAGWARAVVRPRVLVSGWGVNTRPTPHQKLTGDDGGVLLSCRSKKWVTLWAPRGGRGGRVRAAPRHWLLAFLCADDVCAPLCGFILLLVFVITGLERLA